MGANFNRGIWNDVERLVYKLIDSRYTDVYVCTGPLYLPTTAADGSRYFSYNVWVLVN